MAIGKDEKTALGWLKKQTKAIDKRKWTMKQR
jgi:hypothetical protein